MLGSCPPHGVTPSFGFIYHQPWVKAIGVVVAYELAVRQLNEHRKILVFVWVRIDV